MAIPEPIWGTKLLWFDSAQTRQNHSLSLQIQQNETKKHSQSQYCREGGTATSRSLPAMSPLEPNPTMDPGSRSRKGTGPECRKGMVPINMLQPS